MPTPYAALAAALADLDAAPTHGARIMAQARLRAAKRRVQDMLIEGSDPNDGDEPEGDE